MKSIFIKTFIPNGKKIAVEKCTGVSFYEFNNAIYVLADTSKSGLITRVLKSSLDSKLHDFLKPVYYINMFNRREELSNINDEILFGTFAWFKDSPRNYIHFD